MHCPNAKNAMIHRFYGPINHLAHFEGLITHFDRDECELAAPFNALRFLETSEKSISLLGAPSLTNIEALRMYVYSDYQPKTHNYFESMSHLTLLSIAIHLNSDDGTNDRICELFSVPMSIQHLDLCVMNYECEHVSDGVFSVFNQGSPNPRALFYPLPIIPLSDKFPALESLTVRFINDGPDPKLNEKFTKPVVYEFSVEDWAWSDERLSWEKSMKLKKWDWRVAGRGWSPQIRDFRLSSLK